jgi:hypothetical protein
MSLAVDLEIAILSGAVELPARVPQTPENRELFTRIQEEIADSPYLPDIPWEYADDKPGAHRIGPSAGGPSSAPPGQGSP